MDDRAAHIDQLAFVRESLQSGGPAHGCRAIDVVPMDGIEIRVLPDRGLDIGTARFAGTTLSWTSAVGETAPHDLLAPMATLNYFGGGLLTTCGLRNVGAPSEGHGLHGAFSHQRASDVSVAREVLPDGNVVVDIHGRVDEASALGHHLELRRQIRVRSGSGTLEVHDRTTNLGPESEPAPIGYHVNFGYPLLDTGTRVELPSSATVPDVGERWRVPGAPQRGFEPVVLEHLLQGTDGGHAWARVVNPERGIELELAWDTGTLPRLHQWMHLAPHVYVVSLEPANCSVRGRGADRTDGTLVELAPGESRTTVLRMRAVAARAASCPSDAVEVPA